MATIRTLATWRGTLWRDIALIAVLPLLFVSTSYALYTQKLTVNGTGSGVTYTSSQGLFVSYTKTVVQAGANWNYSIAFIVKNNGTSAIGSWQVGFTMPTGSTSLVCASSVTCSAAGMAVTAYSTATNKTINAGAQRTFTVTFTATVANAVLQNLSVAGYYANTYQTIPGLTVSNTRGTRTKSGQWYYWPYNFTVTNNSTIAISAWRITATWSSTTNRVQSMATTVNYTTSATQLTITSKTAVAKNSTFNFTGSLGSTSTTWVLSGIVIQGMP
ncbi:cellulose binding domain-containing protein [Candidatus Saccharibacteria bacterium]|nr:MAG: cellulose binding domain-containing protein [Candidatus Saccharibacteria bacterium]